ncbi:MAG: flagellar hook protein FlgE [Deltaproteobacteria bacterium]|nr:flagellar hook protein FlgE [Deltaproteobacteria bacterium]
MALTRALYSGASGIDTYGKAMNIIGDNIANVNTTGFKATRPVFFDMLSAEIGGIKVGTGSRMAEANRLFLQGGIQNTNSPTDLAIQGDGFFVLKDGQGQNFYSRAGEFTVDKNGNFVNPGGLKVQGFQLDGNGNPISGLTDIVINTQLVIPPDETAKVNLVTNLDATESVLLATLPADVLGTEDTPGNWFAGANFTTVMTIYDSLGQSHDLTFVFGKDAAANQWEYRVLANAGEVTGGTAGELRQVSAAGGLLEFNPDGTLNTGGATSITQIGSIAWANGASAQTIAAADVNFTGSTQFAAPSQVSVLSQNGSPSGSLSGIDIGTDGVIRGVFSSNRMQTLYRLALASFAGPEELTHEGNSLFSESTNSGQPLIGGAQDGGFGTVLSGSVELSNVDLATEFVKMVTTQRAFQASARTITVTDGLFEEVANLKR